MNSCYCTSYSKIISSTCDVCAFPKSSGTYWFHSSIVGRPTRHQCTIGIIPAADRWWRIWVYMPLELFWRCIFSCVEWSRCGKFQVVRKMQKIKITNCWKLMWKWSRFSCCLRPIEIEMCFFLVALRLSHSVDAVIAALWAYYKFNRLFTHSLNSLRGAYDLLAMWMHVGRLLAFFCSIDGPTTKCLFATCISCTRTSIKCTSQRAADALNAFERTPFDWPLYGRQADVLYLHRVCFFSPICYTFSSIATNNIFIFYFKLAF